MELELLVDKAKLGLVNGIQLMLTVAGPLQKMINQPGITHEFCNNQAVTILQRDGLTTVADFFARFRRELNHGSNWADQGWKNVGHYMRQEEKGLWRFPCALEVFDQYWRQAAKNIHAGNVASAMFHLGAATHIVQDMCVPHHARGKILAGHRHYENWVKQRYDQYGLNSGGMYCDGREPGNFLLSNAAVSADLLGWVSLDQREDYFHKATEILLPLAQQTTSGLFLAFYEQVCKPAYSF
ncbi:phospholipase c/d [Lucifera butyrica]|uniref:Phospholipase C n=1 Tax=Lucifera butyrica TaxID=1351585 RepID=A0A498RDX7_9FIRM|nr:zinc dependent phospholipase C family protein [Lucifera butyrica]VBB08283.1 phospholipase c/d [Lucifera butyrica]